MKLYKVSNAPVGQRWQSQKAQAAKLGSVEEIETPKDGRQGMCVFLNSNEREVSLVAFGEGAKLDEDVRVLDPLEEAELRAVREATTVSANQQRAWNATDIEDFILNRATVNEVSNIFACLGTRFKELAGVTGNAP